MNRLKKYLNVKLLIGALTALCLMLAALCWRQNERAEAAALQLNALRYKSFYETLDLMDNLQLNLEKLNITSSRVQEQALLSDIARQADTAQESLSSLPVSQQNLSGALKFVNQLSDYSRVLSKGISSGRPLSQDDQFNLLNLAQRCQKLGDALREIEPRLLSGALNFQDLSEPSLNRDWEKEESVDYPTLIYDGPFSDGLDNRSFLGLSGAPISADQAAEIARALLNDRQVLGLSPRRIHGSAGGKLRPGR
jgi:spore germination protein